MWIAWNKPCASLLFKLMVDKRSYVQENLHRNETKYLSSFGAQAICCDCGDWWSWELLFAAQVMTTGLLSYSIYSCYYYQQMCSTALSTAIHCSVVQVGRNDSSYQMECQIAKKQRTNMDKRQTISYRNTFLRGKFCRFAKPSCSLQHYSGTEWFLWFLAAQHLPKNTEMLCEAVAVLEGECATNPRDLGIPAAGQSLPQPFHGSRL